MRVAEIQKLIDKPLHPNPTEWAMDVEDVLVETNNLTENAKTAIKYTKFHNGAFSNYTDELVAILKRIIKKAKKLKSSKGDDVVMTKENVFIVYSHLHRDMMLDVKDFIKEDLGFEPKTLDISEFAGSVWNAFSEKSKECQKAVVLMADDDFVKDSTGKEYKQARPNVFIEIGYMIHKCGLKNVTIICSQGCTMPSDIGGLIYVTYKEEKWTEKLRKQLNR